MSLLACANARSIFESRVVLSALDVLHTGTAVICYCYKTCSFALARNPNFLFHKLFFILVSINCTEALGFVMWSAHSKIYCSQASTRITKLSVGLRVDCATSGKPMYSRKQFAALEAMCRERAALARTEMEYALTKYWLAEAEEWRQLRQAAPFKERILNRPSDLAESSNA